MTWSEDVLCISVAGDHQRASHHQHAEGSHDGLHAHQLHILHSGHLRVLGIWADLSTLPAQQPEHPHMANHHCQHCSYYPDHWMLPGQFSTIMYTVCPQSNVHHLGARCLITLHTLSRSPAHYARWLPGMCQIYTHWTSKPIALMSIPASM